VKKHSLKLIKGNYMTGPEGTEGSVIPRLSIVPSIESDKNNLPDNTEPELQSDFDRAARAQMLAGQVNALAVQNAIIASKKGRKQTYPKFH
jgi:hypothetical protein